jgi:D-psicose/D-tagatose/L-ribulose 3-epimerase
MMKFALCNELLQTGERSWAETCHLTAQAGYDAIEVAPFTLAADVREISPQARKIYADTARRAGLAIIGLHWLLVSPKGLSLTSGDEMIHAATARYLADLVDFCADLGGGIMVLGSPAQRRIPAGDASDVAAERLMTALYPALVRAHQHNVTLCLEPLPAPEADLVLTLAQAAALIDGHAHPNLRTIFDAKSASSDEAPLPDLIRRNATRIAHVHANDANRRGPGYGDTDFVPILAALKQIDYGGYVSVEVFDDAPDPLTVANESLAYLRRCALAAEVTTNA